MTNEEEKEIKLEDIYVGDKNEFNGIIFYMKEPNTNGEKSCEFWFREVVTKPEEYYEELRAKVDKKKVATNKRVASRFINRFSEMLRQLGMEDKQLKDTVYMNLNAEGGREKAGAEFQKKLTDAYHKLELAIQDMKPQTLTVFTCKAIYEKLLKDRQEEASADGLRYMNGKVLRSFKIRIHEKEVMVYEIIHPSARCGSKLV